MKIIIFFFQVLLMVFAAGCGILPIEPSTGHIKEQPAQKSDNIPEAVRQAVVLPPPSPVPKAEKYSAVVNNVPVQELLFALARDAKVNVDIHPGIKGTVTLNAIDQTLPQLLTRIARQVDMRYELDGTNLVVLPDTPYLKIYKIDYVNITRDSSISVNIATQIATTGTGSVGGGGSGGGDNNSVTKITSASNNQFWPTLITNIKDILRETDKIIPETSAESESAIVGTQQSSGVSAVLSALLPSPSGSKAASSASASVSPAAPASQHAVGVTYREAASVIANPENGIISVRATSRQHESVQDFLTSVLNSAKRQVLIEATVIEVQLSNQYQQGIDWQILRNSEKGFNLTRQGASTNPATFLLNYTNPNSNFGSNIAATLSLFESFGNVKVLSSPKLSVLNSQTALLKVVDNKVYFTVDVTITRDTETGRITDRTYTTHINAVPVGFVMSVTPQIDETNTVTLNVRPTISRITGYLNDPNPVLAEAGVVSLIPEIQTREMESLLKIHDGDVAVMGGLMQDTMDKKTNGVPGLSSLPWIGSLFNYKNDESSKSELVIFLRPVVVKNASLSGDYEKFQRYMPDNEFFNDRSGPAKDNSSTVITGGTGN